jgi:hypothetical protein
MSRIRSTAGWLMPGLTVVAVVTLAAWQLVPAQQPGGGQPPGDAKSSYDQIAPVLQGKGTFQSVMAKERPTSRRSWTARRSCWTSGTT